jgi:hypothetical protein
MSAEAPRHCQEGRENHGHQAGDHGSYRSSQEAAQFGVHLENLGCVLRCPWLRAAMGRIPERAPLDHSWGRIAVGLMGVKGGWLSADENEKLSTRHA